MSRTVMLAWSSPRPGAEDEFHRWYDEVHIPQVGALLSVTGEVRRFRLALADDDSRCLAIYELGEGVDPATAAALLGEATTTGKLDMTTAMDVTDNPPQLQFLTSLG